MKTLVLLAFVAITFVSCSAGIKGDNKFDVQGYASSNLTT